MTLHAILPNDIDDPRCPSGGNAYDRRLIDGLRERGWSVREHATPGSWPDPGPADRAGLAQRLAAVPDDALVVVDGLVASAVPEVLADHAPRLRFVVLVHMPLGERAGPARERESAALAYASVVVTTSRWSRGRLLSLYDLPGERVHVVPPGVEAAPRVVGSASGARLLSVAAVTRHKGHDLLVRALAHTVDLEWSCVCLGPLDREPSFVDGLRRFVRRQGIDSRIVLAGPCAVSSVGDRYAQADLLVLPSRGESYGMVVTEALARGIPVVATAVQGLPEALGRAPDGARPGILVPPDDPAALAAVLRRWLSDPSLREWLRTCAARRRTTLEPWTTTVEQFDAVLAGVHSGVSR